MSYDSRPFISLMISRDGLQRKAHSRLRNEGGEDLERKAGPEALRGARPKRNIEHPTSNDEHRSGCRNFDIRCWMFDIHFFLRPSRIFKNERLRISSSVRPVASASSSLIAPQLSPRKK